MSPDPGPALPSARTAPATPTRSARRGAQRTHLVKGGGGPRRGPNHRGGRRIPVERGTAPPPPRRAGPPHQSPGPQGGAGGPPPPPTAEAPATSPGPAGEACRVAGAAERRRRRTPPRSFPRPGGARRPARRRACEHPRRARERPSRAPPPKATPERRGPRRDPPRAAGLRGHELPRPPQGKQEGCTEVHAPPTAVKVGEAARLPVAKPGPRAGDEVHGDPRAGRPLPPRRPGRAGGLPQAGGGHGPRASARVTGGSAPTDRSRTRRGPWRPAARGKGAQATLPSRLQADHFPHDVPDALGTFRVERWQLWPRSPAARSPPPGKPRSPRHSTCNQPGAGAGPPTQPAAGRPLPPRRPGSAARSGLHAPGGGPVWSRRRGA